MSYNRSRSRSGSNPNSYAFNPTRNGFGKGLIALHHGCYICGGVYSSAGTARNHIRNVHGYEIPGRVNGVNRPIDKKYQYTPGKDTVEYNELHYACPSCWFHCPRQNLDLLLEHTVSEHNPKRIVLESDNEYDKYIGMEIHRRGSAGRPRSRNSRPSSRQSNRSTNSRPSSRQGYISSDEEEVPINRPSSRQVRILDDRKDTSLINEADKNELAQKIDELRDLFHALFRS